MPPAEIVRLINSSPRSPLQEEIEAIIGKVHLAGALVGSLAETDADTGRADYLSLVDDLRQFLNRTKEGDSDEKKEADEAEIGRLMAVISARERQIWRVDPKTWGDVLLRAEIALFNENDVMETLHNDNAYLDERSAAQVINAVLTVGRRFFGHNDDGRRSGDV